MGSEHILAFVLFTATGATFDIRPEYKFASYTECERFATNHEKTREIILEHYSGEDYQRVIPACKQVDRATAMLILQKDGI